MLYFSELQGKNVFTEDMIKVGKLEDMIFKASEKAVITKLVIRSLKKEGLIIPLENILKINKDIIIKKEYNISELQEDELFVLKNILDKQIIDFIGNKVVRVNDVIIQDKGKVYVSGVDIGIFGILRRFNLEDFAFKLLRLFNIRISQKFLSWVDIQPLELAKGNVRLRKEEEKLEKLRPEDLADYLEQTNIVNVRRILGILDEEFGAEVIENLTINYQIELFKHFTSLKASKILSLIDPDEAVDILLAFPKKRREDILHLFSNSKRREIEHLLNLSKTPIGDILTTEYITVGPETIIKEVSKLVRKENFDFASIYYIYVINNNNQFVGVFDLHDLVFQHPDTPVYKFMTQNVIAAYLSTPREIVLKKMLKYKLLAMPIINKDKNILGVVTFDDISEFILKSLE